MVKVFDLIKMKVIDNSLESKIKSLDSKYLKSGKVNNIILSLKNSMSVDLADVKESYKHLRKLSKELLDALDKAIEIRSYKGYEDKNKTYENLVEITNCIRLINFSGNVSSFAEEFFKKSGTPKTSVNKSLKLIDNSEKGFIAKPKIKDFLRRFFALLKQIAFAPPFSFYGGR